MLCMVHGLRRQGMTGRDSRNYVPIFGTMHYENVQISYLYVMARDAHVHCAPPDVRLGRAKRFAGDFRATYDPEA